METTCSTKKAAKDLGLRLADKWVCKGRYPKPDSVGIVVKGETYYSEDETEEVTSRSAARKLGLRPAGPPVGVRGGRVGGKYQEWEVYRISECIPIRPQIVNPPQHVDLLAAIFAVNRAAKRYRNTAQLHYRDGRHGLAGHSSKSKRELYQLKDFGIAAAYQLGRIQCDGIHGTLAIYRGEGYCFHSTLVPESLDAASEDDSPITIEAKPRELREARLCDAVFTLEQVSEESYCHQCGLTRLELPEFSAADHYRLSYLDDSESDESDDDDDDFDCDEDDAYI